MAVAFPSALVDQQEVDGYSRAPVSNLIVSPVDVGEPKRRVRFTGVRRRVTFSRVWSLADFETFEDWFEDTLSSGAVAFTMTDPVRSETGTYQFQPDNAFTVASVNGAPSYKRVTLNLIQIA